MKMDCLCFSDFVLNTCLSLGFSVLIGFEYFVRSIPQQSAKGSYLAVLGFIPFMNFVVVTLVLFYLPLELVSPGQVISQISQLFLWTIVIPSYTTYFNSSTFCSNSLFSIKSLILTQLIYPVFKTYILLSLFNTDQSTDIIMLTLQILLNLLTFLFAVYTILLKNNKKNEGLLSKNPEKVYYLPEGLLKKLSMFWIFPLLKLGNSRTIESTDIPPVGTTDQSAYQSAKLEKYIDPVYNSKSAYSLIQALVRCYIKDILIVTALGSVLIVLDFTSPIFVKLLENYLSSTQPLWRGCALIVYLVLCKLLHTLLTNYHNFLFRLLSFHIQSALSAEVFKKLLKVPVSRISESTENPDSSLSSGKILNLLNTDTGQLTTGITDSMKLILLPFTCALGFYLMFISIGFSGGVTGTCIIFVLLILNTVIGKQSTAANKKLMGIKDNRIKLCSGLLTNIRVFKIFNWELKISDKVLKARECELEQQTVILLWFLLSIFLNWGTQDYMAAGVISTMALTGETLTPANVFSGLAAMKVLNSSIFVLPPIINSLIQTRVSVSRLQSYLRIPNQDHYIQYNTGDEAILLKNANFVWRKSIDSKEELTEINRVLKDLNFSINKGELIAVVGKVASGKSSLLQALIENIEFIKDPEACIKVSGKIAYCSQEPWIQNRSIRENILFGKKFVEGKYWETVRVCMLEQDLNEMPGGDLTEIGEKGINLSGGQKARINIARAVYADTDILLFDDPLAALDQYVSKNLFEECIYKHLNGKTRILVTNNQQFLSHADRIFVLESGKICQIGTFNTLISSPGYFRDGFMTNLQQSSFSNTQLETMQFSILSSEKKLIDNEDRVAGKVDLSVYKAYYKFCGTWAVILGIFIMVCWQGARMFTDFYLAFWTTESVTEQHSNLIKNVIIFVSGSILVNLMILAKTFNSFYSGIRASRKLFIEMVRALRDAPIPLFYDVNPMGRVINRMTGDVNTLDSQLVYVSYWAITQIFNVLMVISFCVATVPQVLIVLPFAVFLGIKVQRFYLTTSREVTRLNSMSKSPICQYFSETISGLSTIRAFDYQDNFFVHFCALLNISTSLSICDLGCYGWITISLELVFSLILTTSSFFIITSRNSLDIGLAGACLIYSLNLPQSIYYLILSLSSLENSMVSVERVNSLSKISPERPRKTNQDKNLNKWPSSGQVVFTNFSARYRPDTEIVLKSISFTINPQEKIAVMGRTGSGKSSIVNSLFRIIEKINGFIYIDGIDIAEVGLDLLRQNLCVILQEPTLFEGTLRENIDIFGDYDDGEIEALIKKVGLDLGLNALKMIIKENGSNLSVGQKQLVCIVRALLKKSKIVVMDEATASIDFRTDELLQEVIRERLKDKTVISIAHRIASAQNYDKILVMDQGRVAEFDTYENLIQTKGIFWTLAGKFK